MKSRIAIAAAFILFGSTAAFAAGAAMKCCCDEMKAHAKDAPAPPPAPAPAPHTGH